jgi:predicted membrane protein
MDEKQNSFLMHLDELYHILISGSFSIIWAVLLSFILLGAGASLLLLIKFLPSISLVLFHRVFILYKIMFNLLYIFIVFAIAIRIAYYIIKRKQPIERVVYNKEKREVFKQEIIKEIKGEINNARRTTRRNNNAKVTKQSR